MRRLTYVVLVASSLAGCGTSTGIVQVGPRIYSVSEMRSPVLGGGIEARRVVLAEASDFCRQQGLLLQPLQLRPSGDPYTPYYPTAFDAVFSCVTPAPGR